VPGVIHARHGAASYGDLFVGRDTEVAEICRLLSEGRARLLTPTGPPGIGKTRLAVAAASASAGQGDGTASFVDLAPVTDPSTVLREVARGECTRATRSTSSTRSPALPADPAAVTNTSIVRDVQQLLSSAGRTGAGEVSGGSSAVRWPSRGTLPRLRPAASR
jgi:predicted ATPase